MSIDDMFEAIFKGWLILSLALLHKVDIKVSPPVLELISSWYRHRGSELGLLTPKGWFEWDQDCLGGQRNCDYLWLPE